MRSLLARVRRYTRPAQSTRRRLISRRQPLGALRFRSQPGRRVHRCGIAIRSSFTRHYWGCRCCWRAQTPPWKRIEPDGSGIATLPWLRGRKQFFDSATYSRDTVGHLYSDSYWHEQRSTANHVAHAGCAIRDLWNVLVEAAESNYSAC